MDILIPTAHLEEVTAWILSRKDIETHAFLFGAFSPACITTGRLWKTPPDAYQERSAGSVVLKKEYVIKALEYARHNGLAIIDVHSHPNSAHAHFSGTDDAYGLENARWVKRKAEQGLFPQVPWGMIVIAERRELKARLFDFATDSFKPVTVRTPLDFSERKELKKNKDSKLSLRFHCQSAILPVRELLGVFPNSGHLSKGASYHREDISDKWDRPE